MTYANEDFDRMQHLAYALTDTDRKAGRAAPPCGYSAERVAEAKQKNNTARPACPDCHRIHTVPRNIVGAHLWDVCRDCLTVIDAETRKTLAARGVVLA